MNTQMTASYWNESKFEHQKPWEQYARMAAYYKSKEPMATAVPLQRPIWKHRFVYPMMAN
jgi:hypothetical protein